jgi:hypothetical protein
MANIMEGKVKRFVYQCQAHSDMIDRTYYNRATGNCVRVTDVINFRNGGEPVIRYVYISPRQERVFGLQLPEFNLTFGIRA